MKYLIALIILSVKKVMVNIASIIILQISELIDVIPYLQKQMHNTHNSVVNKNENNLYASRKRFK